MQIVECAGGIVLNLYNDVLVVTNKIGTSTFPKGTRKAQELPIETALREITEESGLTRKRLQVVQFLGTLIRPGNTAEKSDAPSVVKHIDMFHYRTEALALHPLAPDSVRAQWVHHDELHGLLTWPEELAFFEAHRAELNL